MLLPILVALFGLAYIFLDNQLYYYGKNNLKIYETLPLGIKPEFRYDFEGGFVLRDKYGFALSGCGVSLGEIGDTLLQNKIMSKLLKYGFNVSLRPTPSFLMPLHPSPLLDEK